MEPSIVVWWTIDSLRRDVCSLYGGDAYTPTLDHLACDGNAFEGRSEATWTLPSVTSILTGKSPDEHGVTSETDRLRPGIGTLPQYFRHEGWRTVGIAANPWFTRRKGLDVGFDYFYNITEDGSILREVSLRAALNYLVRFRSMNGGFTLRPGRHPSEPLIADLAHEQIAAATPPVFMLVHTQGAHSPYFHPSAWNRHAAGSDQRRAGYLNLVEYVDGQLGRFVRRLPDDSLVIVTSDHGEALGESDKWGHKAPEMDLLYDVPLVVNGVTPDLPNPVSHLKVTRWLREEIAPTANGTDRSDALQRKLAALGYVDGEHTV